MARGSPVPVFNIEVQVDHTYRVASVGVLVHNGSDDVCGYRAVSSAELEDIKATGAFRPNPSGQSMEDKWFSETSGGAEQILDMHDDLEHVVGAKVPRSVYDESYKHPNIDGTGPGFVVPESELPNVIPNLPDN